MYRIEEKLFTNAYCFREEKITEKKYLNICEELRNFIVFSEKETKAFKIWANAQIEEAKKIYPKSLRLELKWAEKRHLEKKRRMSNLSVTLIDVGWGDSVLIESQDDNNGNYYALVDSNDSTNFRSSFIFLKRHFEKKGLRISDAKPIFEFVLLSHAHSDHGQGLKSVIREFGTKSF